MTRIIFLVLSFTIASMVASTIYASGNPKKLPALILAKTYQMDVVNVSLQEYWVSEKLDGVRAYWNGRNFISRKGNIYHAPNWFLKGLPKIPLDGELWLGRGKFETLSAIVRRQFPKDSDWKNIRFMVFDLPSSKRDFNSRLAQLERMIKKLNMPHVQLIKQYKVQSQEKLMQDLDKIVSQGAEGLMLHLGSSFYKGRRTSDLLKLKKYEDAEAMVIQYFPGKGKYKGMLGAVLVETADGKMFKIGTGFSDEDRKNPPPVGSIVTYKYYGLTNKGLPRFASYMRRRMAD